MMSKIILKLKYKIKSFKASRSLIKMLEIETTGMDKKSGEYLKACNYNSYIKMSRIKITSDKFEAKIRKVERLEEIRRLEHDYQDAVKRIARRNGFHAISVDLADEYYYRMSGTK